MPEQAYIDALVADLESNLPKIWGRRFASIFIGGGTPSLFSAESLHRLLQQIHARVPFHPDIEITMEANPGTFEQERFCAFREAGINRLSIGVQSFSPQQLQKLGRIHGRDEAVNAIAMARQAGFDNINLDLMFALPGQNEAEALQDLQQAIDLQPNHISWYQLTIEPNTVFYKTQPALPDDDAAANLQIAGQQLLQQHGFSQYEISAYCQSDHECLHNLNYWQFGDYLGIGAGAHSKLTDMQQQTVMRQHNVRQPSHYLDPDKPFVAKEQKISDNDMVFEFMMNALRLKAGVTRECFVERTGLPLSNLDASMVPFVAEGLIDDSNTQIKTTELGFLHLNRILSGLL